MPKQKVLTAKDIIRILELFGFQIKSQKGSHIKLYRIVEKKEEILIIPNHKELDKGTQNAIYKQALRFVDVKELEPYFFNK